MSLIKAILFPTDFSDYSNRALPYAISLAKSFDARLVLMHVAELEEADPANPRHQFPELNDFEGQFEVERVIIRGHSPYKDILDVSRAKECDMIVMATHGRSALSQFFLGGSVAEEVARFSRIPVFIVKSDEGESFTGTLKEVLFTTDFSDASARAFPYALLFAETFGASLHALHIIDGECEEVYRARGWNRDDEDFRAKVEQGLREFLAALPGGGEIAAAHVIEGRTDTEIVRFAEANGMDLIAIATQGHTALGEEILGTTTDRVIRHAHCPVMAVRV